MNVLVAVPTYNRAELFLKNKGTVKFLNCIKNHVDIKLFLKNQASEINYYNEVDFEKVFFQYNYISEKRYQIIQYALRYNYTHLLLLDDDLKFYKRFEQNVSKCKIIVDEELKDEALKIFWVLTRLCNEKFPMTGLPFRKDMRVKKYRYEKNNKLIQCVCLYLPVIKKFMDNELLNSIRFKSDYCLQLLLLAQNYRTVTYNGYCYEDFGQNSKGGCSQLRTIEELERASKILYQEFKHTGNIKLRMKKTNNPNWSKKQMLEVQIQWKKFLTKNEKPYLTEDKII